MPPTLLAGNTDSLGERIQAAFPDTRVVKTLNTVAADVMVNPGLVNGGDHDMFVSGNDAAAKATVSELLKTQFGWKNVHDLGDITTSRGTESYLPLWIRMWGAGREPPVLLEDALQKPAAPLKSPDSRRYFRPWPSPFEAALSAAEQASSIEASAT